MFNTTPSRLKYPKGSYSGIVGASRKTERCSEHSQKSEKFHQFIENFPLRYWIPVVRGYADMAREALGLFLEGDIPSEQEAGGNRSPLPQFPWKRRQKMCFPVEHSSPVGIVRTPHNAQRMLETLAEPLAPTPRGVGLVFGFYSEARPSWYSVVPRWKDQYRPGIARYYREANDRLWHAAVLGSTRVLFGRLLERAAVDNVEERDPRPGGSPTRHDSVRSRGSSYQLPRLALFLVRHAPSPDSGGSGLSHAHHGAHDERNLGGSGGLSHVHHGAHGSESQI